jgi:uncharacterized protein
MVKPRGPICNLACEYCYFLSKEQLYPGSDFRMSDELLEEFTKQYLQSQRIPQVTFAWQGGEPTLMGIPFFEKALAYQRKYTPAGVRVENALQTNGTLLDDKWGTFLKENDFLVGISVDGPPELHNIYRKDTGGHGSADKVLVGLETLMRHQIEFNILCTVHAGNESFPLEVYRYFRDALKADFIQFIPIVERMNKTGYQTGNKVTERSVSGQGYGDFLIAIFDEWVKRDVGSVFVQIFDIALAKWVGAQSGLCVFEETCGLGLVLEHSGDLYSCDHFVEPKYKLGNISKTPMADLVESHQQYRFGIKKINSLPKYCQECDVRFACNGGCPKNRIRNTPDGEYGLNYLCEGYRAFFKHIDQPMQQMANLLRNRRPPFNIMKNPGNG